MNLKLHYDFSGTGGDWTTPVSIPLNTWSHITLTYNADDVANDAIFYINGVALTTTNDTTPVGTRTTDVGSDLTFGNLPATNRGFDGEMAQVQPENFLRTAAEVLDLISGNIPFKNQWGSQDLIVPSDDCSADLTANWTDVNCALTHAASEYTMTVTTGATAASTSDEAALTVGKEYTATVLFKDGTGAGATASINVLTNAGAALATGTPITVAAAYAEASVTWIATETNNKVQLLVAAASVADGETVLIDTITTKALGAVFLADNTSMSPTHWSDKANDNDGVITGATLLNEPDAMSFGSVVLTPGAQDAVPKEGQVIYNAATNKLNVWTGAAWEVVTSA
jgi:hypothetical protein